MGSAHHMWFDQAFQAGSLDSYPLINSAILDSGASIHIFNNLQWFRNIRRANNEIIIAGTAEVPIRAYGTVHLPTVRSDGSTYILRLANVAYCPAIVTNLVSAQQLEDRGIYWSQRKQILEHNSGNEICVVRRSNKQYVLHDQHHGKATAFYALRRRRITSKDLRPDASGDGWMWHARLGHPSPMTLHKLEAVKGVKLKGPKTVDCPVCSQAKMRQQISRRPVDRENEGIPGHEAWIDWTDLTEDYDGFVRVMFITDAWSSLTVPYFMKTREQTEHFRALKDYVKWMEQRHGRKVKIIRSDNELFTKKITKWLRSQGISDYPSAPNTPAQNGGAESAGADIIRRSRSMRIAANLPHDLWREIIEASAYLKIRTPLQRNQWKTPFELFYGKKPQIGHLKAYGCRAYAMTADAQRGRNKLQKLDPRAHVGYLVGYDSTNIYRVWIPHLGKVISTRDVIFDENTIFDGNKTPPELTASINEYVEAIQIPETERMHERTLHEQDHYGVDEITAAEEEDDDPVGRYDDSKGDEDVDAAIARQLEEAYLTPPPSEDGDLEPPIESVFHTHLPTGAAGGVEKAQPSPTASTPKPRINRFDEFKPTPVKDLIHGAFIGGYQFKPRRIHKRDLPEEPRTHRDLKGHKFEKEFREAQREHLRSHHKMQTFEEVLWRTAKGHQILGCRWVFVYKTDKHGYLTKCKARLVVCGNQQEVGSLPTRATTLATNSFRILMAIAAELGLELHQMDAVNAFVNCDLDETVFMRFPPGYEQYGRVLRLRKALYGLRRSPLLWQQEITGALEAQGFERVPYEPCAMRKGQIIVFFFVDDIIWAYPKTVTAEAQADMQRLRDRYDIKDIGEPQWFLGIHIIRDRAKKTIWLAQDAYIDKIAHQFKADLSKYPKTPMTRAEITPHEGQADQAAITRYQKKVGSVLFAAISTRPDVAFAVSRLARHNHNPSLDHQLAIDRVIEYLYSTRSCAIRLGGNQHINIFLCASDASFADNPDRRSTQGHIMQLYGGTIAWRSSKQATVTTSTTEAELLAISAAAREAIFTSRLLGALQVDLVDRAVTIQCDNKQTVRLIINDLEKLNTKLRHVDIHDHWLRQEQRNGNINVSWVPTNQMIADGLTKSLTGQQHEIFLKQIGVEDIRARIENILRMEAAKDRAKEAIRQAKGDTQEMRARQGYNTTNTWWIDRKPASNKHRKKPK